MVEIYRIRGVLEPLAVELAVAELSPDQLAELERLHAVLKAAVSTGRGKRIAEANAAWHWLLYDSAHSTYLNDFIRRLWDGFPWRTMWALPGRADQSVREHEAMMATIRRRDPARGGRPHERAHRGRRRDTRRARADAGPVIALPPTGLREQIASAEVGSLAATEAYLERIERLDGELGAFITVDVESALGQARAADEKLRRGEPPGLLHGLPVALKDNIDTAGLRTTVGSSFFADRVPDGDAEVARRVRLAGAVILGKVAMHEFAYGATSQNAHFGPCRNPWDVRPDSRRLERRLRRGGRRRTVRGGPGYRHGGLGADPGRPERDQRAPAVDRTSLDPRRVPGHLDA